MTQFLSTPRDTIVSLADPKHGDQIAVLVEGDQRFLCAGRWSCNVFAARIRVAATATTIEYLKTLFGTLSQRQGYYVCVEPDGTIRLRGMTCCNEREYGCAYLGSCTTEPPQDVVIAPAPEAGA